MGRGRGMRREGEKNSTIVCDAKSSNSRKNGNIPNKSLKLNHHVYGEGVVCVVS